MYGGSRRKVTRERIVAAEMLRGPRPQDGPPVAHAQVFVEEWPEEAFRVFIGEIGFGLSTIGSSWIRPESGRYIRFGRDAAGRFVEVHDAVADDSLEIGRITVWAPGARSTLTWREPDWPEGASTDVDIRFEPIFGGTLVGVEHSGFERLGRQAPLIGAEYRSAWTAALAWVAGRARARGSAEVSR
jgi:hypothetical protein